MASVAPSAPPITLRAVIYSRVSTLVQKQQGFSLAAQVKDCHTLAAELGATVVAEYEDNDSGAEWDLPQLNAMLDAAKRREFDVLLVYDPDRPARNMAKQLVLEEALKRYGVAIQYVGLRLVDSAEDRLLKHVRASISEYEREKTRSAPPGAGGRKQNGARSLERAARPTAIALSRTNGASPTLWSPTPSRRRSYAAFSRCSGPIRWTG